MQLSEKTKSCYEVESNKLMMPIVADENSDDSKRRKTVDIKRSIRER